MSIATIDAVTAEGNTLEVTVSVPREIRRFFTGDPFRAEYPVDISEVPESVLVIPALAHLAPVAWTRNVDVHVDTVDADFLESLETVQATLREMYPRVIQGGSVIASNPVARDVEQNEGTAQLFTGGIDSLVTYIRHQDEEPDLISINGWTEPLEDDLWERRKAVLEDYGERFGMENLFVRSNMLRFIDHTMLIAHFKRYLMGSWYSGLGSGLGLLGICAPLTYAKDIGTVYVASTVSEERDHSWGSHPDIDNHVGWAGTRGCHDGYEMSRHEKVEQLIGYVESEWPEMPIRTCNSLVDANCGRCEKCSRTALSLVLAGRDPNDHGYEFGPENWDHIQENLLAGNWDLQYAWSWWADLQDHIGYDTEFQIDGATSFFRWLETVDPIELRDRTRRPAKDRMLRTVARNVPYPVYSKIYPLYDQVLGSASK